MKTIANRWSLLSMIVCLASCQNADISEQDRLFLSIAGSAGIMEVKMGELAQQKGLSEDVKQYGNQMVKEHTKINEDFRRLMERLRVEVPDTMNDRNQEMVREQAALAGNEFDQKYIDNMISDHRLGGEKFREAYAIAKNTDYKTWLASMIPVVDHHLKMAEDLKNKAKPLGH